MKIINLRLLALPLVTALSPLLFLAINTPVAAATTVSTTTCKYLVDGGGAGSAASATPNMPPANGDDLTQRNAGAWQFCYDSGSQHLYLKSDTTKCAASNNFVAVFRTCGSPNDQKWAITSTTGGLHVKNVGANVYLCAGGGVGATDFTVSLSNCSSNYHDTWQWESSP